MQFYKDVKDVPFVLFTLCVVLPGSQQKHTIVHEYPDTVTETRQTQKLDLQTSLISTAVTCTHYTAEVHLPEVLWSSGGFLLNHRQPLSTRAVIRKKSVMNCE